MATIKAASIHASLFGVEPAQLPFPEADSQTFKQGALVTLASGKLAECGADPAAILGLAVADGQNVVGAANVGVELITPDSLVIMSVKGTDDANETAAADVGASFGVVKDASGHWCVDKDDTTAKRVTVVRLVDAAGTANGQVEVTFVVANLLLYRAN